MKPLKCNLEIFDNEKLLKKTLTIMERDYRPYDPGRYLYKLILQYDDKDKYSHEFIKLTYVTLSAWNMNSRGAKLNKFDSFKKSIQENRRLLRFFADKSIEDIDNIKEELRELFSKLKLVSKNRYSLVTFSKFLHFYFPKLVVPIDRKYTCTFFHTTIPLGSKEEGQFEKFIQIEEEFSEFSKRHNLKKYVNKNWNLCETKVMDNMIIGHQLNSKKRKMNNEKSGINNRGTVRR